MENQVNMQANPNYFQHEHRDLSMNAYLLKHIT